MKLRKEAAFLDKILSFGDDGKMKVSLRDPADRDTFAKMLKNNEFLENSDDKASLADSVDDNQSNCSNIANYNLFGVPSKRHTVESEQQEITLVSPASPAKSQVKGIEQISTTSLDSFDDHHFAGRSSGTIEINFQGSMSVFNQGLP